MLINSGFCATFEILIAVSVIEAHRGNDEEFWLQLVHGMFGVGGLFGPMVIRFWGEYGFAWIGLVMILTIPGYIMLKSP